VRIVPVAYGKKKGLCLQSVLEDLYVHGLRSVMVEGGPTVHEAFLEKNCVDDIVITVVPRWIPTGVGVSFQKDAQFNHVRALSCHDTGDIVLAGKWISK
jgi:riboflavin biosynthesis pyrimidine reductase